MKSLFQSHFASDPKRISSLWHDCIFVFDTNVLTGIYKYSDETRDALFRVMESLGHRLWIPYQVMFEYLDNRASIVHAQSKIYTNAITKLKDLKDEFDLPTRHPFVSNDVYEEFCIVTEKVLKDLELRKRLHEDRITEDDVKARLADLLDGKVGSPYSPSEENKIMTDGAVRYAQKIPPGFEDREKHKGSNLLREVRKQFGDLIFWNQILDKAKVDEISVILVTGERKEDWWSICGGKTIGPLPELLDEFSTLTGQQFHIYSTHNFLHLANAYLHQNTSSAAMAEVQETFNADVAVVREISSDLLGMPFEVDDGGIESDEVALPNRYDIDHYRGLEEQTELQLDQLDIIIANLREKLFAAELGSSATVVKVYRDRLEYATKRRKRLRSKQRYYSRRINEMLSHKLD